MTDAEFDNIKKIFDLKAGPADYETRMKTGVETITDIHEIHFIYFTSRKLQKIY